MKLEILSKNRADRNKKIIPLFGLAFSLLIFTVMANAQEGSEPYIIGAGDVLTVSFWQAPDLNTEARVSDNGTITLPVVGEIKAAGLATAQLAKNIVDQLAFYQTPVSQATVVVTQFNSRSVVVSGQVVNPSTRSYERIPDLWRVIIDAGGPTSQADLSKVTIIRKEGDKSKVLDIDLFSILKEGDLSKVPALFPGDLVNVPASPFGVGTRLGESTEFEGRNVFFVLGSVTTPGVRNLEAQIDVLDAISLAGGFTPEADLKNVRVVIKGPRYSKIVKIDLKKYVEEGRPPRLILRPEDTVYVPSRGAGFVSSALERVGQFIPIITAIGTIVLLSR